MKRAQGLLKGEIRELCCALEPPAGTPDEMEELDDLVDDFDRAVDDNIPGDQRGSWR